MVRVCVEAYIIALYEEFVITSWCAEKPLFVVQVASYVCSL